MGCGIGCGVVLLLIAIVVVVGYFAIKDTVDILKETEDSHDLLIEQFGDIRDFCPNASGDIPSERIEIFLSVRDSMASIIKDMEGKMDSFEDDIRQVEGEKPSFSQVLGLVRKGFGAIPQFAEYYTYRNYALLATEMSLGEYTYLYVISYYSWLGKSPGDGPNFSLMGNEARGYQWNLEEEEDDNIEGWGEEVIEERRYQITRKARWYLLPMLKCQLEALESDALMGSTDWRNSLRSEIELLESERDRLPWEDGLPQIILKSLEPFRTSLSASYSELLNPLELGLDED
jgi:hypothetical protein